MIQNSKPVIYTLHELSNGKAATCLSTYDFSLRLTSCHSLKYFFEVRLVQCTCYSQTYEKQSL